MKDSVRFNKVEAYPIDIQCNGSNTHTKKMRQQTLHVCLGQWPCEMLFIKL